MGELLQFVLQNLVELWVFLLAVVLLSRTLVSPHSFCYLLRPFPHFLDVFPEDQVLSPQICQLVLRLFVCKHFSVQLLAHNLGVCEQVRQCLLVTNILTLQMLVLPDQSRVVLKKLANLRLFLLNHFI